MKTKLFNIVTFICLFCINGCVIHKGINNSQHTKGRTTAWPSPKMQNGVTLIDNLAWESSIVNKRGKTIKKLPLGLVEFLPDGNLVGRKDSFLVKVDPKMNELWKVTVPVELHHSIAVSKEGLICVLASDTHQFMGLKMRFDVVNIYSNDGLLLNKWSAYDHIDTFLSFVAKSKWLQHLPLTYRQCANAKEYIDQDPCRFIMPTDANCDCDFEFTHFTSAEFIEENSLSNKIPAFKPGNILVCFNPYSSYGVINPTTGNIEWVGYLPERTRLHSPTITNTGSVLVFQNSTDSVIWGNKNFSLAERQSLYNEIAPKYSLPNPEARMWSSVTEYNPVTNNKIWEYTATPKELMQVPHMGGAQRLANGNTLVCITTSNEGGRVFELTPDNKIVWEYTPLLKNEEDGLPLNLYRAKRISNKLLRKIM